MPNHHTAYDALDLRTGLVLRPATAVEIMGYYHQWRRHPDIRWNTRIGEVVVGEYRAHDDGRPCDCYVPTWID